METESHPKPRSGALEIVRRVTGLLLLLALAAVFIISAWSKLQTIEPFAWSFIDVLPVGITGASVLARVFIGLEFAIAGWLAGHILLRRVTYRATLVLLVLLSAYLAGLIAHNGNNGNCGCFGEWIYMKPAAAIWKNVALAGFTILLYFLYPARPYRAAIYVALGVTVTAFALPFVIEPVRIGGLEKVNEPIVLDSLYTMGKPRPAVELRQGAHVVCFFSTTCPHCKKGAYLVQILHRQYPELPVFMVLNGGYGLEADFLAETKSESVPHTLIMNTAAFSAMAGRYVPSIYWIRNSVIERKSYYTELEPGAIREWLVAKP